ncbi:MAG: dihydroorotate dehydrogenase [Nitrospirae bacterium]|nr:dihydroorotate dehydrogenase [Nitrospirota bacterium]
MNKLETSIGALKLKNPVMTASGTFGYGEEYSKFIDLNRLGAVVVKGISLNPMEGNPVPRIYETPSGMLNAIGLQNVGLKVFIEEKLPFLRRFDTKVIVNILGNTVEEYVELARHLEEAAVDAIELNVSCPNVKKGGIAFGTDLSAMGGLVEQVRAATRIPIITKLSPNAGNIAEFARVAENAGSDAVSLINTLLGLAIDPQTRRPRLANITGGLSGPAIRPIAVRMVWEVFRKVKIPIIGMGGIMDSDNAIEFILAGATAVAVGTANFVQPDACERIVDGLECYVDENGLHSIREIVGGMII